MKNIKITILTGMLLAASGIMTTSCSDLLDLSPIDYYGSGSYWTTEAQVTGYMDGIHKHIRDMADQHIFTFGELRGGIYKSGNATDGNALFGGSIVLQNFDKNNTGVTNFGGHYGRLANINLFIDRVTKADYVGEAKKNFYLGQAYGLRAFIYFELYRIYGGVPLRLDVEVIDGLIDPEKLYMARSTPKEVMTQVKKDLDKSMEYFGNVTHFDPYGRGNKVYWSRAATECLMGEVYLWTSKVTTGDNPANTADLTVAKRHLESVANNYGLKMLDDFASVFDAKNKANSEIIFAIRYAEGEATNSLGNYTYVNQGEVDKGGYRADGTKWDDPLVLKRNGMQWYEYIPELYHLFDEADARRDATFIASYQKDEASGELSFWGTHVRKNIGLINAEGNRVYCGDQNIYRLPWVYLSLAEIANMEDDNANVEKYINLVRKRAYGSRWDAEVYGYKAGDFTQNELAILHEKDKEFVQEGQRWWDVYRMTLTKGGKHLVFCPEANLKKDGTAILNETEAYKVLWPIEQNMLDKDPAIKQTPGYEDKEADER